MKIYWGVVVQLHTFLTSALDGGEWSVKCSGTFTLMERAPGIHWLEGWVGPTAALDTMARRNKYPSYCRESNSSHPTRSLII